MDCQLRQVDSFNIVAQLGFDSWSNLLIFSAITNSPFIIQRMVPLNTEFKSPRAPTNVNPMLRCPYSKWEISNVNEYFLDMSDRVFFQSVLLSPVDNPNLLDITSSRVGGVSIQINRTTPWETTDIVNVERADIHVEINKQSRPGITDIVARPNSIGVSCEKTQQVN
jgi:hypothetical protein